MWRCPKDGRNRHKNVQTQAVGFAPIPGCYFEKCGIGCIIDEQLDLDPRRKGLTHGQAAVAMMTAILVQVMHPGHIK